MQTWVITKSSWKLHGTTVVPAFVCFSKKEVSAKCKALNDRAKKCVYKAVKVPNNNGALAEDKLTPKER